MPAKLKLKDNLIDFAKKIAEFLKNQPDSQTFLIKLIENAKKEHCGYYNWSHANAGDFDKLIANLKNLCLTDNPMEQSIIFGYKKSQFSVPLHVLRLEFFEIFLKEAKIKTKSPINYLLFHLIEAVKKEAPNIYEEEKKENIAEDTITRLAELLINSIIFSNYRSKAEIKQKKIDYDEAQKHLASIKKKENIALSVIDIHIDGENLSKDALDKPAKRVVNLKFVGDKVYLIWHDSLGFAHRLPPEQDSAIVQFIKRNKGGSLKTSKELKIALNNIINNYLDLVHLEINPKSTTFNSSFVLRVMDGKINLSWWDKHSKEFPIDLALHEPLNAFLKRNTVLHGLELNSFLEKLNKDPLQEEDEINKVILDTLRSLKNHLLQINESGKIDENTKNTINDILSRPKFFIIDKDKKKESIPSHKMIKGSFVLERNKALNDNAEDDFSGWSLYIREATDFKQIKYAADSPIAICLKELILHKDDEQVKNKLICELIKNVHAMPVDEQLFIDYAEITDEYIEKLIPKPIGELESGKIIKLPIRQRIMKLLPLLTNKMTANSLLFIWDQTTKTSEFIYLDKFRKTFIIEGDLPGYSKLTGTIPGLADFRQSLGNNALSDFEKSKLTTLLHDFKPKTQVTAEKKTLADEVLKNKAQIKLIAAAESSTEKVAPGTHLLEKKVKDGKEYWVLYCMEKALTPKKIAPGTYVLTKENAHWALYFMGQELTAVPVSTVRWQAFNDFLKQRIDKAPEDLTEAENLEIATKIKEAIKSPMKKALVKNLGSSKMDPSKIALLQSRLNFLGQSTAHTSEPSTEKSLTP